MTTFQEFTDKHGISIEFTRISERPDSNTQWGAGARHYRCKLGQRSWGPSELIHFSMGSGLREGPTAVDLLTCLASDVRSVCEGESLEDWASETGYDTDSRKAERTYNATRAQEVELRDWLPETVFLELLDCEEE